MIAYTATGIPFHADPDDGPRVQCSRCSYTSEGACVFCDEEICETHTRWAEGYGCSCPSCVVELITDNGDVIYVSRREHEKEQESLMAARENKRKRRNKWLKPFVAPNLDSELCGGAGYIAYIPALRVPREGEPADPWWRWFETEREAKRWIKGIGGKAA